MFIILSNAFNDALKTISFFPNFIISMHFTCGKNDTYHCWDFVIMKIVEIGHQNSPYQPNIGYHQQGCTTIVDTDIVVRPLVSSIIKTNIIEN